MFSLFRDGVLWDKNSTSCPIFGVVRVYHDGNGLLIGQMVEDRKAWKAIILLSCGFILVTSRFVTPVEIVLIIMLSEDEEARLRQKLLEKRSVLSNSSKREVTEVERGSTSSVSVTIVNVEKKSKSAIHSASPKAKKSSKPVRNDGSSDEEMFSIQPKDIVSYSASVRKLW